MTEAQDTEDHEMTEAQDTEDHEMTEAQDTEDHEMTEAQDTIEIQEVEALGLTEMIMVLDLIEVRKIIEVEKHTKQLVVTVETNVKYHSNQNMTDLFIAKNVSKITNHKNVVVTLDLTEDQVMVETTEAQDTEDHEMIEAPATAVQETTEVQDTIKANLDSKKTVLQFTVETILERQNIRQRMRNHTKKILGITILIILIRFILL
jgi:hypothetical protein